MRILSTADVSDQHDVRTIISVEDDNGQQVDVMCKYKYGTGLREVLWYVMDPVPEEVNQTNVIQFAQSSVRDSY